MFDFYTVEEWEDHLAENAPQALLDRAKYITELGWSSSYILIQKDLTELNCNEWIKEHCEGGVWKKYTHQYEFQLKKDALLFKLVWTK